jgi:hypothetical protein
MNAQNTFLWCKGFLGAVVLLLMVIPAWARPPKVKGKPFQPVTFYPLKGTYVIRVEGSMDLNSYRNVIDSVEIVPLIAQGGKSDLNQVKDSRSVRLFQKNGSYVDGGFGVLGRSMESPTEFWAAGFTLECPTEITTLELRNLGSVRDRIVFSPKPEEPVVEYRMPEITHWKTKKVLNDAVQIDLKVNDVDFGTAWITSTDFKTMGMQPCRWPNIGAGCGKVWEKYIIFVLFKGVQPYCANVYEIGKGWLNSVEIVEELFRRDLEKEELRDTSSVPVPVPVLRQ